MAYDKAVAWHVREGWAAALIGLRPHAGAERSQVKAGSRRGFRVELAQRLCPLRRQRLVSRPTD